MQKDAAIAEIFAIYDLPVSFCGTEYYLNTRTFLWVASFWCPWWPCTIFLAPRMPAFGDRMHNGVALGTDCGRVGENLQGRYCMAIGMVQSGQ
jgi:hypothetical protein